jgi:phospholipid transport system substrate-binding protein
VSGFGVNMKRLMNSWFGSGHTIARAAGVATALWIAIATGLAPAPAAQAELNPMDVVKQTVNQALDVLRDRSIPLPERQAKLRGIVSASFDFREMSRSAMGYHWRSLAPDQRKEFTRVFATFIEDSYLAKINDYSNQHVDFLSWRNNGGPDYAQVRTNIVRSGNDPIALNFLLLNRDKGWKVYDVTVDAISIIANYRNQFNRVMNNKGYATLIGDLKSKQAALAASLGTHK